MDRFFLSPDQWGGASLLEGDEAHHCARVMRKQVGETVAIFDGRGRVGEAGIESISRKEVALKILTEREDGQVGPKIEIVVGIPKGKTFDLILQKAVEMGVGRIQPLMSEQGNVRFKEAEGAAKQGKWERLVLEACKQCGQNHLPEVAPPTTLVEYLDRKGEGDEGRFVAALTDEASSFRTLLCEEKDLEKVVLMIGPEGDFSQDEYGEIFRSGFAPVSLGDLVLRTETAVFWMVAAVRYHFQS